MVALSYQRNYQVVIVALYTTFAFLLWHCVSLQPAFADGPGELDTTFGLGGIVIPPVGNGSDSAHAVAIGSDGKILVVGQTGACSIARYSSDGALDTSFGDQGSVRVTGTCYDIAVTTDGKIVVAGEVENDIFLKRFHSDGSSDSAFGSGGIATLALGPDDSYLNALQIQPNGKLLVSGFGRTGNTNFTWNLIRYAADGTLDPTFGTGGLVTESTDGLKKAADNIDIQIDGKIVIARKIGDHFAVSRHLSSGVLDTTFGGSGVVTTTIQGATYAEAKLVTTQDDGKIVAVGRSSIGPVIVRYQPDGSLDSTFGTDGIAVIDIVTSNDLVKTVTLQSDGKIIVAGGVHYGNKEDEFTLVRYHSDGTLDSAFGEQGIVVTTISFRHDIIYDLAMTDNDRILAVGIGNSDFALAQYLSDGSLDGNFGQGGIVKTNIATTVGDTFAISIQPDGKIVAAGSTWNGNDQDIALIRLTGDGMLDPSFGEGGLVLPRVTKFDDRAFDMVLQPDGKIITVGHGRNDFAVLRHHADGSPDLSFGSGGSVITPVSSGIDQARAVVLQPDGKIVAAGFARIGPGYDMVLVRYHSDGDLDPTFGTDGIVITDVTGGADQIQGLAIQPDGKLVAVGHKGPAEDFVIIRYLEDGSFDETFGTGGVVISDVTGVPDDLAQDVEIQPDGKIIVAGYGQRLGDTQFDFILAGKSQRIINRISRSG